MAETGTGVQKLTEEEVKQTAELLKRVTPLPRMEYPVLRAIWEARLLPMALTELVILDRFPKTIQELEEARVLLLERDDKDFPRCTHHPGGFMGAGEQFELLVQRVAQKEIGAPVQVIGVAGVINNRGLLRDHEVAIVCVCWVPPGNVRNEKAHFFPVHDLPDHILKHHIVIHEVALCWLRFALMLPDAYRAEFLRMSRVYDCILQK